MPFGIPDTLLYGGLVFIGGGAAGYFFYETINGFGKWECAVLGGTAALGAYVFIQKELFTALPVAV